MSTFSVSKPSESFKDNRSCVRAVIQQTGPFSPFTSL